MRFAPIAAALCLFAPAAARAASCQQITATPYAIRAANAATASSVAATNISGTVTGFHDFGGGSTTYGVV